MSLTRYRNAGLRRFDVMWFVTLRETPLWIVRITRDHADSVPIVFETVRQLSGKGPDSGRFG